MSINHTAFNSPALSASWCSDGTYCYCKPGATAWDSTMIAMAPPVVEAVSEWLRSADPGLVIADAELPGMFGTTIHTYTLKRNGHDFSVTDASKRDRQITFNVSEWIDATDAIAIKRKDPYGDGSSVVIRPALGLMGSYFDDDSRSIKQA